MKLLQASILRRDRGIGVQNSRRRQVEPSLTLKLDIPYKNYHSDIPLGCLLVSKFMQRQTRLGTVNKKCLMIMGSS